MRTLPTRDHQLRKLLSVAQITVLTFAVLLPTACAVRLIGDYDDTIDKGITDVQQKAEPYFSQLRSNPGTPYDQTFYDDLNSRLAVLKTGFEQPLQPHQHWHIDISYINLFGNRPGCPSVALKPSWPCKQIDSLIRELVQYRDLTNDRTKGQEEWT